MRAHVLAVGEKVLLSEVPLVLLVLVEGALRLVGFAAAANETSVDLVGGAANPFLGLLALVCHFVLQGLRIQGPHRLLGFSLIHVVARLPGMHVAGGAHLLPTQCGVWLTLKFVPLNRVKFLKVVAICIITGSIFCFNYGDSVAPHHA